MPTDPRSNTKVWLDKWIVASNLTKDDGSAQAKFLTCYTEADYPIVRIFIGKSVSLIFAIEQPVSKPLPNYDCTPFAYDEKVPIVVSCVDKSGITGTKLMWKGVAELRRIAENHPFTSFRSFDNEQPNTERLGSTIIHSVRCVSNYVRSAT